MERHFMLKLKLGNADMQTQSDAASVLRLIASKLSNGESSGYIRDVNGNTIGEWFGEFEPETE